jgi:hypothetical protein
MKPIAYMVGLSLTIWIGLAAIVDARTRVDILFGMLGPLIAVTGTWLLATWAQKEHPDQLTGLMAAGFILKMIFFAGYVAVMLRVLQRQSVPFVVSFTCYFIGLYLMEALYLKRLFSERSR